MADTYSSLYLSSDCFRTYSSDYERISLSQSHSPICLQMCSYIDQRRVQRCSSSLMKIKTKWFSFLFYQQCPETIYTWPHCFWSKDMYSKMPEQCLTTWKQSCSMHHNFFDYTFSKVFCRCSRNSPFPFIKKQMFSENMSHALWYEYRTWYVLFFSQLSW